MPITNKRLYNIKIILILLMVSLLCGINPKAQGLRVINYASDYCLLVQKDSLQKMTEIKQAIPSIIYDLRYATKQNFTHVRLYKKGDKTFARLAVVHALANVQNELAARGCGLKIWDAYRPYSVTKKMWDLIHDDRYVADPSKGSGHNRGIAVDVTIVDIRAGKELDMGTGFDNFTDSAHHTFKNFPVQVLRNRDLLKAIMEKYGFKALETEWWHYSWPNDRSYEVLDLNLRKVNCR